MLANFFEKTKPINSIVVGLVFCLFYFMSSFLSEKSAFTDGGVGLGFTFFISNFAFLLLSGVVIIGNKISNDNLFAPFFMVLMYALFPKALEYNDTIYVLLLFVLLYRRFSSLSNKTNSIGKLLDSGLFIGVMFLFFNWTILYLLLVYVALFLFREVTIRKLIIPIVGAIVPVLFYYTYCLIIEDFSTFYSLFEFNFIGFDEQFYEANLFQVVTLLVLVFFSVLFKLPRMLSVSTIEKQHYTITLFSLIIGISLFNLSSNKNGSEVLYVFIPIAIIIGQFMDVITKKWLKELVFISFIILSLIKLFTS
jgi:hypothetical protein